MNSTKHFLFVCPYATCVMKLVDMELPRKELPVRALDYEIHERRGIEDNS